MGAVALIKCRTYESPALAEAVGRAVDLLGGMGRFVRPGQKVLLKPNMLSAHPPESCICTHPGVVLAVGRLVLEAGGSLVISDSPALDRFARVAAKSGLGEVAAELGAELVEFGRPQRVAVPDEGVFKSLELSAQVFEADVIINLPKLKTHSQMLLTLGVKNLFGTVVAQRKAEWHAMVGLDRVVFASLLLDIHRTVRPALTILDGIHGMEGRGPANGQPRAVGLVAASTDALALDLSVCRLLGVPLKKFPLYRAALSRGLIETGLGWIQLLGDRPEDLAVKDFLIPELEAVIGVPRFLGDLMARFLVSKPVQKPRDCIECRKCVEMCQARAIVLKDRKLTFDYDRCIRCYCCQEVCPQDAIGFRRGPLVRVLNRLGR
jgi:uncharacterized protein (DUF362 family)/Pyruvate/2-oxoacid:ferredoxin oxidoreductase delta subunit